jgi:ribosomal protein L37E
MIVYQPRTGALGARQGAELELSTRHCGSRRVAVRERECLSCKVTSLARRLSG